MDIPYSSKPYLSCGTWITASVESYFHKRGENSPTRFVIAPNGSTLEQLCVNLNEKGHDFAYDVTCDFFEKRLPEKMNHAVIKVFGGWAEEAIEIWKKHPYLHFRGVDPEGDFLHQSAMRYALSAPKSNVPLNARASATQSDYYENLGDV